MVLTASFVALLSKRVEEAKTKMLEAGAVSQETAKTAAELDVEDRHVQSRLWFVPK